MQIYRKPKERRTRIEAEWFGLLDERMPMAFWCAVSHEVRRRRVTRKQTGKLKALIQEQRRIWNEKAGV